MRALLAAGLAAVLLLPTLGAAAGTVEGWRAWAIDIVGEGFLVLHGEFAASPANVLGELREGPEGTTVAVGFPGAPGEPVPRAWHISLASDPQLAVTRWHVMVWFGGVGEIAWSSWGNGQVVQEWSGSDGISLVMGDTWGGVQEPVPGGAYATAGLEHELLVEHNLFGAFVDAPIDVDDACLPVACVNEVEQPRLLVTESPEGVATGTRSYLGDAPTGTYRFRALGASAGEPAPILAVADLDIPWDDAR